MTREEIKEFSGVEPNCFETDREEDWYKIGCIDGLNTADADPDTSSLWHPADEEPGDKDWKILCEDEEGGCWVEYETQAIRLHNNWKEYTAIEWLLNGHTYPTYCRSSSEFPNN